MLRVVSLCLALGCVWVARGQPVSCTDHEQCTDGYYCEVDSHLCKECLRCQDLKRDPPLIRTSCIKSVSECGVCLQGLVFDPSRDVNAECVPPDGQPVSLPWWGWALLVAVLLALVVSVVVYVMRHVDTLKVFALTRTSVDSAFMSGTSPPSAPPPYEDAAYTAVRPHSPNPPNPPYSPPGHAHDFNGYTPGNNESPLLYSKRASPRPAAERESDASQEARVFNQPAYMRGPHDPPSPEAEPVPEAEEEAPFAVHDEDTVESLWTPHASDTHASNDSASSSAVVVGDVALVSLPPPAKRLRLTQGQDGNNNRGEGERSPSPGAARLIVNNFNIGFYNTLQIDNTK